MGYKVSVSVKLADLQADIHESTRICNISGIRYGYLYEYILIPNSLYRYRYGAVFKNRCRYEKQASMYNAYRYRYFSIGWTLKWTHHFVFRLLNFIFESLNFIAPFIWKMMSIVWKWVYSYILEQTNIAKARCYQSLKLKI